jgi:N-acetyl-anhydromuramyl-L-alanine amidase AmpD
MKPLLVVLVAALSIAVGGDGYAQSHHRRHPRHADRAALHARKKHHRARRTIRTAAPKRSYDDEMALAPAELRQLQRNLIAGGYLEGPIDGKLTKQTRRALTEFQREYHLRASGALDRRTVVALLGREVVGTTALASTQ